MPTHQFTEVSVFISLLEWINRGGLEMYGITAAQIQRIIDLTYKCGDLPMDLADATLVVAAEALEIREIISIDSDFYVYRTIKKDIITNIFEKSKRFSVTSKSNRQSAKNEHQE